ncbi:MAG: ATP-binding protein [Nitrosopumilus sp. B06]|nr:MAG: ATP-binding protein [Nitrosopumilus sp. B06]
MINESDMRKLNPWWSNPTVINEDLQIQKWNDSKMRFIPEMRDEIKYDFSSDGHVIYTLRGSRQVGKTTLIKLQIKKFLKNRVPPENILYYSLDASTDYKDITKLVEMYMKKTAKINKGRCYLFLDEASTIKEWGTAIKMAVDNGTLKNCTVVVSGSHALNLSKAREKLVGRMGDIADDNYNHKILLPMSFSEYVSLLDKDIKKILLEINSKPDGKKDIFLKLLNHEIDPRLEKINLHMNSLNNILREYMLTGGFPQILNNRISTGVIPANRYTNYLESITSILNMLSIDENKLKALCGGLIQSQTSNLSNINLAKESRLGSYNTVDKYINILDNLLVVLKIHQYNAKSKNRIFRKNPKLYFQDPFLFHTFNGWTNTADNFTTSLKSIEDETIQGKIMEGIVADHLIRWAFRYSKKVQTFSYTDHVFYWKDDKNREVDFILYDGDTIEVPIEVKYRNQIRCKELGGLTSFLNKTGKKCGIVISKHDLEEKKDYTVIPAPIFLLLM